VFRDEKIQTEFLNKKWLNMNEKLAYNKILKCINDAMIVDIYIYIYVRVYI
jgi:hypothetical protein